MGEEHSILRQSICRYRQCRYRNQNSLVTVCFTLHLVFRTSVTTPTIYTNKARYYLLGFMHFMGDQPVGL